MRKIKIGIDINEIFRAKWLQTDRFYVEEFGESGTPEQPYVYDIFNNYVWKDTITTTRELKEPDEMPDNINPIHYQVDEKTGEALADYLMFNKTENKETAKEIYNKFMFEDFVFEIFGASPIMYRNMDLDVKNFYMKYKDHVDFTLFSIENHLTKPHTLIFLSKMGARFNKYEFVEDGNEMWQNIDVLITTDPELLTNIPWGKKVIKVKRPYNENINVGLMEILQINDLTNNKPFEKLIKYKTKK